MFRVNFLITLSVVFLSYGLYNYFDLNACYQSIFGLSTPGTNYETGNYAGKMVPFSAMDPSSYSRPDLAVVTNINMVLKVNFTKKTFSGHTDLTVQKVSKDAKELFLDVQGLKIDSIIETETQQKLKFEQSDPFKTFGSRLSVELPPKESNVYQISINYETSPNASGLQWLEPEQTSGKKHPYVFSQFQAVHARSFLPCQDTPGVKAKYQATITAPKDLTVLMSAVRSGSTDDGDLKHYTFTQNIPVPAYLIAVVIGALQSREIGPRSTVWAEKEIVDAAAHEFEDTEVQLKTAEDICGPYVWGIYDLLVLPPSFPFGGMENPCLTFVTPTLLAGDKSLANVIAHEIAHSWTGNLVTNANFEHFWLNEGFTVFIERKISGRMMGSQMQDFEAYMGTSELNETLQQLGLTNPLTNLVPDLKDVHPDDAFSRVPYEKGHTFLRYLENLLGGPSKFEPFLREYFDTYKYKSIVTDDFKGFLEKYFKDNPKLQEIDWNSWLHKPGAPPVIPVYDGTLRKSIDELKKLWLSWNASQKILFDFDTISSTMKIQLLQELLEADPQPVEKLEILEKQFKLSESQNAEIKYRWLRIGIKAKWEFIIEPTIKWLKVVGRMKFTRCLYRDMYNWEEAREKTVDNYLATKINMMHVSAYTIGKDLHQE